MEGGGYNFVLYLITRTRQWQQVYKHVMLTLMETQVVVQLRLSFPNR